MDVAQFNEYQQHLAGAAQERQIQYDQTTRTNAIENITAELLKPKTFCGESSDVATRAWIDDIDLAFHPVGQAYVVDSASSSVTGSLRNEEHFIQQSMNNLAVTRDAITWPSIRTHVVKSFLNEMLSKIFDSQCLKLMHPMFVVSVNGQPRCFGCGNYGDMRRT